jgi:hypothetical protein
MFWEAAALQRAGSASIVGGRPKSEPSSHERTNLHWPKKSAGIVALAGLVPRNTALQKYRHPESTVLTSDCRAKQQKRNCRSEKLSPIHHGNGEFRSQRGAGKLKALIVTAILIFGIYAGFKLVPPYSAEYQLNDKIQEIARFGVVERKTEEQIRESVFKTIQDLDIPATRDNIKVSASSSKVAITVDYTVPVDLLFYHVDLHFTPTSENKSLT